MLNHLRTLLMNRDGNKVPGLSFYGEQLIPRGYRAFEWPSYLLDIRQKLFGSDPDRHMLNYRLAQFMPIVHGSNLAEYVVSLDPRVTYVNNEDSRLYDADTYVPMIEKQIGTGSYLVTGEASSVDEIGRMRFTYRLEVQNDDTVDVTVLAPSRDTYSQATGVDTRTTAIPLNGSGYSIAMDNTAGNRWQVDIVNQPSYGIVDIVNAISDVGETSLVQVFGLNPDEPFETFRNVWFKSDNIAERLSAILLAVGYRLDTLRDFSNVES